ncbi:hypothetical protein Cgig2_029069 [Carnegiea gigantea]|uniref:GDSL esterase/lipase EXL3 n=1 Tax=Carnegiea gigantea TaxID=171969 RepID=A0A9Q1KBB6_9CARY|nr:hypothetical protein Cgig2_029069 [Carnegiea gigantea]
MHYYSSSCCPMTITLPLRLSILLLLMVTTPTEAGKLPPNVTVPALFGFGDSIIDPGNNNHLMTLIKCNFPPYGKDFKGGIPTGRFSNGKIPTDMLAEALSIKEYVAAYLDPNLKSEDLLSGVSFASGACGYDPLTSKIASVIPLSQQLEYFREYAEKAAQMVGDERAQYIISQGVHIVVAGSDDIANTYFGTPFRRVQYDVDSYTDLMLHSASQFIQELYNLGARKIAAFGAPPIGCVPSQRTLGGGIVRDCADAHNHAAQLFNSKLSAQVYSLASVLPNARLAYIDVYSPLYDIVQNPHKYGIPSFS